MQGKFDKWDYIKDFLFIKKKKKSGKKNTLKRQVTEEIYDTYKQKNAQIQNI